jgi:hypothetical protein
MTTPISNTTIYGLSGYGTSLYGIGLPSGYIVDPFTATPYNYEVINLNWTQCSNPIVEFRLLRNRYGYPVDENDGEVLLDELAWPGNAYIDNEIIPGSYHYYGIYVLVEQASLYVWIRAGLAACLIQEDLASDNWMYDLIPEFLKNIDQTELTADATGNLFLFEYLEVIGWGLDYLKTQYNLALQCNNPQVIPLDDLMNLAAQIGYPFEPEIASGVMRSGIANAPHVSQERGTLIGLTGEVSTLTGWEIVPLIGYNQMLEDDNGFFVSPVAGYAPYNPTVSYNSGEYVTQGNWVYTCLITGTLGTSPPATGTSNSHWQVQLDTDNTTALLNPVTNGINTFEARYTAASAQVAAAGCCREGVGVRDPLRPSSYQRCSVRVYNTGGSPQTCELRSIARLPSDLTLLSLDPDPQQVILDGVPVPYLLPTMAWQPNTEIETNAVVSYQDQPFIALRPSTGVAPSLNTNIPSNEWQPIGLDNRLALMMSGYVSQALSNATNCQTSVTPYVVWYDQWGRFIAQVFSRNPYNQVADVSAATAAALASNAATATTLTASSNSAFPAVDGVTLTVGKTVLVQNEVTQANNGLYSLTTVGSGSVKWVLTRTSTANTAYPGLYVEALAGATNGGTLFYCQNATTPTFGSTAITFSATPPTNSYPSGLFFDSFTSFQGITIAARAPDIGATTWVVEAGGMTVNAFSSGSVVPTTQNVRSYAVLSTLATCQLGVTFCSPANSGYSQAIVFRWASDTSYWRADQNTITKRVAGVFVTVASHATPFLAGDRMNITLNGSVITVYRNGVQVSTVTDAFNNTAAFHGVLYEPTTITNYPTMMRRSASVARSRPGKNVVSRGRLAQPPWPQAVLGTKEIPEGIPRTARRKPPSKRADRDRRNEPPWPQAGQGQTDVPGNITPRRSPRKPPAPRRKDRGTQPPPGDLGGL